MAANPVPLSHGLADQFDAMRWPTAFFQADVDVGGKSEHVFDRSEVEGASQVLYYENWPSTCATTATSS